MKNQIKALSLALTSSALFGCSEDVDSDDVRTSGLYADFQAVSEGEGSTHVSARLKTGGADSNTFADLQGDDQLFVSAEDEEVAMSRSGSDESDPYEAELGTDEGGTEITISLERGDMDVDAPDSTATLPPSFTPEFSEMDEGDSLERGNDITVEWDNEVDNRMYWQVEGDCVSTRDGSLFDTGTLTIDESDIEVRALDEGEECEVTLVFERLDPGPVDSALGGGEFLAIQRRTLTFLSLPAPDEAVGMGGSEG